MNRFNDSPSQPLILTVDTWTRTKQLQEAISRNDNIPNQIWLSKELESRTISFESDSRNQWTGQVADEILELHHQQTSKGRKCAELANRPIFGKPNKLKGERHLLTEF
jgi:hypothetical protein